MKVILLDTIKKLGKRYDVIDINHGYAQNFLIPQKKAVEATEDALARISDMKAHYAEENAARLEGVQAVFKNINDATFSFSVKANEQGGLYQAIDATAIAHKIKEDLSVIISPAMIDLDEAIKEVGTYTVKAEHDGISSAFTVVVTAEE